jgi:hypothetical protein
MRRFFTVLFILSLIATAGAFYWRTFLPEAKVPVANSTVERSAPEAAPSAGEASRRSFGSEQLREFIKTPSDRQNLALTISILSSIISAVAAVAQTWLTARAYRR